MPENEQSGIGKIDCLSIVKISEYMNEFLHLSTVHVVVSYANCPSFLVLKGAG